MRGRGWHGWAMSGLLAIPVLTGLMSAAQADETVMSVSEKETAERRIVQTKADNAENRNWAEGNFEGTVADTGSGRTLAVLNSDKPAKWIVVFDKPSISKALFRQSAQLHSPQATALAGALQQNIAQEQKKALNMWKANNLITAVNAQFDMLINGTAVEATGEQIEKIAKQPGVANVHPDYVVKANLADSVPLIGAPDVWAMTDANGNPVKGGGIRVAVIDTGIDYMHSAFGSCSALNTGAGCRVIGGYDFVNKDADPIDDHSHGTHVAGIIAGNDATITGVAPEASLYAYKVLSADGWGYESDIIAALERAADPNNDGNPADHVDAANLSLGGSGGPDDPMSTAVDQAVDQGISVVVAAGNSGYYDYYYNTIGSPGVAAKAITVGATDKTDKLAYFSSRGPVANYIIKPDLVAPGVDINSSVLGGNYATYSGTSMATPHVAGAVALLKQLHPDWTPVRLKAAVANSARDLGLNPFAQGSGRLQLAEAASSTYLAMPNSLSMGLVDNTVSVWTKTQALTVYNDADTAQTINLNISGTLPAGLTAELSQDAVTLAAGESQDVNFTMTVDNAVLPYPSAEPYSYSGKVVMTNGAQVRQVPFAVVKAAQLVLNWDVTPTFVLIHNRKSGGKVLDLMQPASPYYALLPPDTYDIISWWSAGNYTVVNEGIVLSGSMTKNISRSEATYSVDFNLKDHTGAVQPAIGWTREVGIWQPATRKGMGISSLSWGTEIPFDGFVSGMSSTYNYSMTGHHRHGTTNTFYVPAFATQGVSADINVTNDYEEAKLVNFTYNVPDSDLLRIYFIGAVPVPPPIPNLTTESWYLFPILPNAFFDNHSIFLESSKSGGPWYVWGNDFTPTNHTSYTMLVDNYKPSAGPIQEQIVYSDSGWQVNGSPHYWAAHTSNTASTVVIQSNAFTHSWNGKLIFVRSQWQDETNIDVDDVKYDLLDSSSGSVQSGTLGNSGSQTINAPQGAYTLNTSYPGLLRGKPTAGTMTATFDTSKSDKNPPVIQELQIRQNGERTDTVADGQGQVAVRAADANSFTVAIAVDLGNGWQNLTVSTSGSFQTANIPAFHPAEDKEVSLRITLTDASGNKMVNTIAPAFIVQKAEEGWTLAVNSANATGVAITGNPSNYSGTTNYTKTGITDGTSITLTAPADASGKPFSIWTGCDSTNTTARTCTVAMFKDKTVTARYTETRTLAVNSSGASGVTITGSPSEYGGTTNYTKTGIADGTSITLTAPAASGSMVFSAWSGCDSTNTAARTCTVAMWLDKTVTANYLPQTRSLSVNSSGATSVAITGSPSAYGGTTNYTKTDIADGTSITLTAPSASGSMVFSAWSGCDSTNTAARTCTVAMSADKSVTVSYVPQTRSLSVNSSGATSVAITGSPSAYGGTTNYTKTDIADGTSITLTAPSASGSMVFSAWSGCDSTNTAARTCTVAMSADKSVTVSYVPQTRSLSVNSSGASGVTITGSPSDYSGTTNYTKTGIADGTSITLTAPSASGSMVFSAWSGCDSTNAAARTCTVAMSADKSVTVSYVPQTRSLSVNSSGASGVTITGSPSDYSGTTNYTKTGIADGTSITLTAPSASGSMVFSAWSGCDSTNAAARTCTVAMSADKSVTVSYAPPASSRTLVVKSSGAHHVPITGRPCYYGGRTTYSKKNIADGKSIKLTAPAKRWTHSGGWKYFSSWSGCDSTDTAARTCTVTMSANKTVTANYAPPRTLLVRASGAHQVSITGNPSYYGGSTAYFKRNIPDGTSITLTAPEKKRMWFGWRQFSSWSGCDSTDTAARTCTVTMSANKAVTVKYN